LSALRTKADVFHESGKTISAPGPRAAYISQLHQEEAPRMNDGPRATRTSAVAIAASTGTFLRRSNDLRDQVRESTRAQHTRIDTLLSRLDLAVSDDYVRFLKIHAEAFRQLGGRLRSDDRADAEALYSCLQKDLGFYAVRPLRGPVVSGEDPLGRQLGFAYVIRGSRLGAKILVQRVAAGAPCSYLSYRPGVTWTSFLAVLDSFSLNQPAEANELVVEGAKEAFGIFLRAVEFPAGRAP
jgi:heme oxygenase